jgi:glutaredoxin
VTVEVVVYTGRGCHLCDDAKVVLERERRRLGFTLREVDITDDPELEAAHREHIPVVFVGGQRAFTYWVHPDELERRVRAATIGA